MTCLVHSNLHSTSSACSVGHRNAGWCTCAFFLSPSPPPPPAMLLSIAALNPFPWQQKTTAVETSVWKTFCGNTVWFCSRTWGNVPRRWSADATATRYTASLLCLCGWFQRILRKEVEARPVLVGFCRSWFGSPWHYIVIHYFAVCYGILLYFTTYYN